MNARKTALEVFGSVLKNRSYLNLELKKALKPFGNVEDKRFITALASTALENLYRIDYVLEQFIQGKRVHTVIRNILRLGACQLMFFESVPVSAAVNESVKLVQSAGKPQLKGFVNAVLRNVSKNLGKITYPDIHEDPAEYFHIFYSYPKWLCKQYIEDYGREQTEQMLSYTGDRSLTCIRLHRKEGFAIPENYLPGKYCPDAYYIRHAASIEQMAEFKDGTIAVQGEASMLCVQAAGITAGGEVLDACAAPGGKSAYAASLAAEGHVTAMELHEHRARLMEKTFERLGVENVTILKADASLRNDALVERFDTVMVDAPCSALGLLYRKPDIKLFKEEEDLAALSGMQRAILGACAGYVKPGGVLLYSTCTIDRRENEDNIKWFLREHPEFVQSDLAANMPAPLQRECDGGMLQLFPHRDGIDGFFIARLVKAV